MKFFARLLMAFLLVSFCFTSFAQAEKLNHWAFPWVANRDGQWATQMVLTNPLSIPSNYTLKAIRSNGDSQEIQGTLQPNETKILEAGETFAQMGSGLGYTVYVDSDNPRLRAKYLIWSITDDKLASPACGDAIPLNSKQYQWSIDVLSRDPSLFSAIVVVNPNDAAQEISWKAFASQKEAGRAEKLSMMPWKPMVLILDNMVPDEHGMLSVELTGELPLLATGFIFSSDQDPAIIEARESFSLPDAVRALNDTDFSYSDPAKVELGKALFWDKIISGNQNISCGTCHHTMAGTGDGLSLPIGEGGKGIGIARNTGGQTSPVVERVPRNAPPLFNIGAKDLIAFFHDGRVGKDDNQPSGFISPAGDNLLPGLDDALAAQAMFPVTSHTEMRGQAGENPIADAASMTDVWTLLTGRVMEIDAYQELFRNAYPDITVPDDVTFAHIANSIAAYEDAAFQASDTPFDEFLNGNDSALNSNQKRGMTLFYGKANCGRCHSGPLMTSQNFSAVGIPPIGGGKGDGLGGHDDFGRERVTKDIKDRYKFRIKQLRNVAVTGPWGHSGAYNSLEAIVRHKLDPQQALDDYDPSQVVLPSREDLDNIDFLILNDTNSMNALREAITLRKVSLSEEELSDLMAFLHALTDKKVGDMRDAFPRSVPSELPVFE